MKERCPVALSFLKEASVKKLPMIGGREIFF
jgi:hypothetical protein